MLKTISDQVLSDINKTGDSPLGTNPENYNNTGTEFGRYLYSDTYGSDSANSHYLDSLHFFAAAYYQTGMAGDATYYLGLGKEVDQCYRQKISSCGSPEDLASNRAGADFGKYLDLSSSKSVASQLREWLTSIGKTYSNRNTTTSGCVKDSPRQDKLPETDNKDFKQRVEENKKMNEEAFNKGANGEEGKFSFWDNPWGTINYWLGLWDNVTTEMDTSTSESFR